MRTVGLEICVQSVSGRATSHFVHGQHRPADEPCRYRDPPLGKLTTVPDAALARTIAYLYDHVNSAHPFRESSGRSTREFFDFLLAERGAGLDWEKTDQTELDNACHTARADSDLDGLVATFARILDTDPAYDL